MLILAIILLLIWYKCIANILKLKRVQYLIYSKVSIQKYLVIGKTLKLRLAFLRNILFKNVWCMPKPQISDGLVHDLITGIACCLSEYFKTGNCMKTEFQKKKHIKDRKTRQYESNRSLPQAIQAKSWKYCNFWGSLKSIFFK